MVERFLGLLRRDRRKSQVVEEPFDLHNFNVHVLKERCVRLLSFQDILSHSVLAQNISDLILFDSPGGVSGTIGNHWRILSVHSSENKVSLMPCSPMGRGLDNEQLLVLSLTEPYFTGVSITTDTRDEIFWAVGFKGALSLDDEHCITAN